MFPANAEAYFPKQYHAALAYLRELTSQPSAGCNLSDVLNWQAMHRSWLDRQQADDEAETDYPEQYDMIADSAEHNWQPDLNLAPQVYALCDYLDSEAYFGRPTTMDGIGAPAVEYSPDYPKENTSQYTSWAVAGWLPPVERFTEVIAAYCQAQQ